jgi:putative FmdB family regulatory protein
VHGVMISVEMPIYEYQCRHCAKEFELLVLPSTIVECPSCNSRDLDQLLSGFAVSSDGMRQANARSARRASVNNSDFRDKKVADAEYVKKHSED